MQEKGERDTEVFEITTDCRAPTSDGLALLPLLTAVLFTI